jgi:hypothetical protein
MAKKRRIKPKGHHAVGASLSPQDMAQYLKDYYDEQGLRQDAKTKLTGTLAEDPLARATIAHDYKAQVGTRATSLAAAGLSERGYDAGDLTDISRTRILAENDQNSKLRAASAEYTSTIARLNTSRTAQDANALLLAGQNIQAGTGKYKKEKPKGWRPPALAGAVKDVDPATGQPVPAAPKPGTPTPVAPPAIGPTGIVRPPTGPRLPGKWTPPRTRKGRSQQGVGYAKGRVKFG